MKTAVLQQVSALGGASIMAYCLDGEIQCDLCKASENIRASLEPGLIRSSIPEEERAAYATGYLDRDIEAIFEFAHKCGKTPRSS